jgi:exopolyphosphatase/guanosine-5'-triphosphate,3'-diphosphate pyrophosphatase
MEKKYISPKTAIIDLGSNSVRLMLTGESKQSMVTRLGEGLSFTGLLSREGMNRTLDAVLFYVAEAKKSGAQKIHIFGTQAMRAAKNARDFRQMIFDKCGLDVDIIDGQTEALCGFLGAAGSLPKNTSAAVIDIGGASTEITIGVPPKEITYSKSVPVGTVALRDYYLNDKIRFDNLIKTALENYGKLTALSFVGIGGTFCSLSAMIMQLKEYDAQKVDNSKIEFEALNDLFQKIWPLEEEDILKEYGFLGKRARVIKFGALWTLELMRYNDIQKVIVSEKDNLEGYCVLKNIKF